MERQPQPPSIEVTVEPQVAIVSLHGEHDLSSKPQLAEALGRASKRLHVLVDMCACTFFDSSVIGTLIATYRSMSERGGRLELVIPREASTLHRITRITGLATIFTIHETRQAGLASLQAEE